jgi:phage tail sheath protein FI
MVVDEWQGAGHLDPTDPQAPAETARRQQRLIAVADLRKRFVALLDAPSRLSMNALTRWRSGLDSAFAAAYYPWLRVPGDDADRLAVPVPPSAVAAGVIAARERRRGLAWGPANEIAVGVVLADDLVPDAVHDELHLAGINVFRAERDGFRLTAARTLSSDPRYRQLSVRRLMTMIVLSVEREAQALVFEPNTTGLRAVVTHALTEFLRDLYRQGAFAGDTEQSSFFVRCDDRLNPPESLALGRLITEIGVALSSPLEYLVLRISQDVDGTAAVTPVASPAAAVPASLLTADAMRRAGA